MPDQPVDVSKLQEQFAVIPTHIAFIMDGNGRWASQQGKSASAGHRAGAETVREVLRLSMLYGIKVITLFAFSSENWQRPPLEVKALMTLFASYLKREVKQLHADNVCLRFIGNRANFSKSVVRQMEAAEELTKDNSRATLVLAVDYGGQWDIAQAAKAVAAEVLEGSRGLDQIDVDAVASHIALADLPAPDLCIRTANEQRISNFLLWQLAYAELYFSDVLWPDFGEQAFCDALREYQSRDRRFGGRQLSNNN